MTTTALLVMASALIVCAICTVLVFHPDYDDSILRRFSLALLAIGAYLRMAGILEHHDGLTRTFSNVAILVWFGLALFMADHFYNFLKKSRASRDRKRRADDRKNGHNAQSC